MVFKKEVFSLWIGPSLSILEQAAINSFLKHDFTFILYVYEPVKNVPENTIIKDANNVINFEKYKKYNNPSFFSNLFRYKRLYEVGGIWVDMDIILIHEIDDILMYNHYIFTSEKTKYTEHINAGMIGCIPKTTLMLDCYNEVKNKIKQNVEIRQGMLGPKILKFFVDKHELNHYVEPYYSFCYYGYNSLDKIFSEENHTLSILADEDIRGLHLWNNALKANKIRKEIPVYNTIYNKLIELYKPDKTFKAVIPPFQSEKNYDSIFGNVTSKNIIICYAEDKIEKIKNENPNACVILIKNNINYFITTINRYNTHVYRMADKISITEYENLPHKNKIIIKNILKK